jgi:hypothetical protein
MRTYCAAREPRSTALGTTGGGSHIANPPITDRLYGSTVRHNRAEDMDKVGRFADKLYLRNSLTTYKYLYKE